MMFKNSLKLAMSNFYNFWKIFLYKVVILAFVAVLISLCFNPVAEAATISGLKTSFINVISQLAIAPDIVLLMQNLFLFLASLVEFFIALYSSNVLIGIFFSFVVFVLFPFLCYMSNVAIGELNYGYMSSLSRFGFLQKFITKFGASYVYACIKTLINIVFIFTFLGGNYLILSLTTHTGFVVYLVPVFAVVYSVVIVSLYQTFMSGYMPAIVVFNDGAIKGFNQGLKTVSRRFFRTLSNLIAINTLFFAIFYLFGIYSLIVLIPLYSHLFFIFQMVMFFGSNGMRYYVDLDTILTPKKLETYDKYRKTKDLL